MTTRSAIVLMTVSLAICLHAGGSAGAEDVPTPPPSGPTEPITVQLIDGCCFTAPLDPRSDGEDLWLRWERPGIVLLRPIRWEVISKARVAGHDVSAEELRRCVEVVRGEIAVAAEARPPDDHNVIQQTTHVAVDATPPPAPRVAASAVRSVSAEAVVANWDADVEVDGLVVDVYPLDERGRIVPVHGTLEADLTAWPVGLSVRQPPVDLGRWSLPVRLDDFGTAGARYRLPFMAIHPEFHLAVGPYGALHVRLSVPGEGVFESTVGMVRIRPYSPVRDRLQQSAGRRFFPQERTTGR